jgi:hypothetical protein
MPSNPSVSPLYSRYFSPSEKKSLRKVPIDNLLSEINLLRILHLLLLRFQRTAPPDFDSQINSLRTNAILTDQLAQLVRVQNLIHAPRDILDEAIERAIESIQDDWKLA